MPLFLILLNTKKLYKSVTIIYLVVFATYVFFTRQPDYLDGEITTATIHWVKDQVGLKPTPRAVFTIGKDVYSVNAYYIFRNLNEGRRVELIFENAQPKKAAIYSWWGYWISGGELIASIVLYVALFQIAVGVTKNPTPESLIEQLGIETERKRKYD